MPNNNNTTSSRRLLPTGYDILPILSIPEEDRQCVICKGNFTGTPHSSDDYETPIRLKACGHIFGLDCITKWAKNDNDGSAKCPLCMAPLPPLYKGDVKAWAVLLHRVKNGDDLADVCTPSNHRINEDAYRDPPRVTPGDGSSLRVGTRDEREYPGWGVFRGLTRMVADLLLANSDDMPALFAITRRHRSAGTATATTSAEQPRVWITVRASEMGCNVIPMLFYICASMDDYPDFSAINGRMIIRAYKNLMAWLRQHDREIYPLDSLHGLLETACGVAVQPNVSRDALQSLVQMLLALRVMHEVRIYGGLLCQDVAGT